MFTFAIAFIIIVVSVLIYFSTFGKFQRAVNKIPGPPTLPLLGNAHLFGNNTHDMLQLFLGWWKQYGQNKFRVWIGFEANVFITDPKDVENVLTSTQILKKSNIYDLLHPWLGEGLLTSFGPRWHSHRKMITPSFHFKILLDFFDVMNKDSIKFVSKLTEASKDGTIFDVQKLVCYNTLDIICETAMGVNINAMDDNDSPVVRAFQYMCLAIQLRTFNPIKRNHFLFKFLPEYKQYKEALDILSKFTKDVISKRCEAMEKEPNVGSSETELEFTRPKHAFLDTLLTSKINGQPLSVQDIYEEVSTFMFEGHDTTASGITFAMYVLSRHAEIQQKVFEEQLRIFDGDLARQPTFNDIQDMKYLDMVIKETQRLYPSVPLIGRLTQAPYDMNGTIIPKGATVNVFIMALGYNEKYFPDPYKFDPERFNPETRIKSNPFEYVPFSAGPRNCIGQKFAVMEMKTVLAKIVREFKIIPPKDDLYSKDGYELKEPKNKYDPIISAALTLKSDNGVHIRLKKRSE